MGIVNVTPDSFSGDGTGADPAAAAALAARFEAEGADILDVGGESTRPGASPLDPEVELARVVPAIRAVRARTSLPVSVDTCHPAVAAAAIAAGADVVNDIWGLRSDAAMAETVARAGVPLVAMHNQRGRAPGDVIQGLRAGFTETLRLAAEAGIPSERVILDPGFGFGWEPAQNLEMVRRLPELWDFAMPLLVGPSRKSTIGLVLEAPVGERLEGTGAAVALAIAGGADIVRVHDVRQVARVARVADAIVRDNWRP
ncbi:MAG: dihydropteroate synthase [Chloroflexi bacterium CFX7]|nr:dihydropteroate synthase [Chloroflexi bacterium CFX7]MCK6565462.1 dihydropteroate synthase [Dehalococcoidia bacterium]MCL4231697.1 dihydropteroate synthase [Dehalococcoidia bacterium]RIL03227.1 MAG: dihydropteroate synthase [bacterium]